MKTKFTLAFFLLSFMFCTNLKAQNEIKTENFIKKLDSLLLNFSENPTELSILKHCNKRTVKITGKLEDGTKIFKHKIKYFKGGTKKEVIKISVLAYKKPLNLLKIILINDEYYYVQKITYNDTGLIFKKVFEETLIDGKIYRKIDFEKKNEQVSVWKLK